MSLCEFRISVISRKTLDTAFSEIRKTGIYQYVDEFGQGGVKFFFKGVPDRMVHWWCRWFHEFEELEAADHDEAIHGLKVAMDRRIAANPDGPLHDARASEWYTQTLAPAAQRHNVVLQVKQKKTAHLTETWGLVGWEDIIDPRMLLMKLLPTRD
jgi:hypothetical protein